VIDSSYRFTNLIWTIRVRDSWVTHFTTTPTSHERIHGLDAYRAVLMLLGIVLHGAIPMFGDDHGPHSSTDEGILRLAVSGVHIFRMPAFFMISGFFGALLWYRRGSREMLKNRFQRVLLPMLIFLPIIRGWFGMLDRFAKAVKTGRGDPWAAALDIDFFDFLLLGDLMHLWFLNYLLWITLIVFGIVTLMERFEFSRPEILEKVRDTFENPWRCVFIFGGLNFIWCIPLKWSDIPTSGTWLPSPSILIYYLAFYGLGWMLFTSKTKLSTSIDQAWPLVITGMVMTVFFVTAHLELKDFREEPGVMPPPHIMFAYVAAVTSGSIGLFAYTRGIMGLFMRYASRGSHWWRYVSDSSYWVYLVHLPVVFSIPVFLVGWEVSVLIKFPASILLGTLFCFITYELAVRSTFVGRFLNGRRYERAPRKFVILGMGLLLGSSSLALANFSEQRDRTRAWFAKGGALSVIPFGLKTAPFRETGLARDDSQGTQCLPAGNYAVCVERVPIARAKRGCETLGGHMVRIKSEAENQQVSEWAWAFTEKPFWLPLGDKETEGKWLWDDGTSLSYAAWAPGQPDDYRGREDCAHGNWRVRGHWNDISCDERNASVCEFISTDPKDVQNSVPCQRALDALKALAETVGSASASKDATSAVKALCELATLEELIGGDSSLGDPHPKLAGLWTIATDTFGDLDDFDGVTQTRLRTVIAMANSIESRVRFGADRLVVTALFAGQRRTQTIPYKIVKADAHSLTIETKEGDQEDIHHLTFQADKIVVRFGSKATVLGPAKPPPETI
jgi:glucans biosynthesis protein C